MHVSYIILSDCSFLTLASLFNKISKNSSTNFCTAFLIFSSLCLKSEIICLKPFEDFIILLKLTNGALCKKFPKTVISAYFVKSSGGFLSSLNFSKTVFKLNSICPALFSHFFVKSEIILNKRISSFCFFCL